MAKSSEITGTANEFDTETILAALCASAPDTEIRDCLRRYNHQVKFTQQMTTLKAFGKPILARTAEYLQIDTSGMKKDLITQEPVSYTHLTLPTRKLV